MENEKLTNEAFIQKENVLLTKSYAFSLSIVKKVVEIQKTTREFVLTRQLLGSATSIGANVEEANQAESKADFVHKLSIANKEANETRYWLRLLVDAEIIDNTYGESLILNCSELIKILPSSIKTSKQKK